MSEATTTKEKKTNKKGQQEEDKINRRLTEADQEWCDWKFKIHWNKLEWLNPRSRNEQKKHFVCLPGFF